MIGVPFNISAANRSIAGNLLKDIYTNTSFEENVGAVVRVRNPALAYILINWMYLIEVISHYFPIILV